MRNKTGACHFFFNCSSTSQQPRVWEDSNNECWPVFWLISMHRAGQIKQREPALLFTGNCHDSLIKPHREFGTTSINESPRSQQSDPAWVWAQVCTDACLNDSSWRAVTNRRHTAAPRWTHIVRLSQWHNFSLTSQKQFTDVPPLCQSAETFCKKKKVALAWLREQPSQKVKMG